MTHDQKTEPIHGSEECERGVRKYLPGLFKSGGLYSYFPNVNGLQPPRVGTNESLSGTPVNFVELRVQGEVSEST